MATQYSQNQEQEDLMADFDAPRKELRRSSLRRRRVSKKHIDDFDNISRRQVNKPTLKTNFFQQTEALKDETKGAADRRYDVNGRDLVSFEEDCTERDGWKSEVRGKEDLSTAVPKHQQEVLPDFIDDECFTSESFNVLLEEIKKVITAQAGVIRNLDAVNEMFASFANAFEMIWEVPKYEEELKYVTAAALVCYGGSWTTLAGIIAAVEAFGVINVVEEASRLGMIFLFEEYDYEYDVTPEEVRACFKNVGLHIALLIAVVICPSWAEMCICMAFASKFSCLLTAEDHLYLSSSGVTNKERGDYFGLMNPEWFDLFSSFACATISLIVFGFFPRMVIAMYMGYLGCAITAETLLSSRLNICVPFVLESENVVLRKNRWMELEIQYYAWTFVFVMAFWQSLYGYSGAFEFISWSMFLLPVVQVYNIIYGEPLSSEDKKTDQI
jgi:hypothetical protein